MTVINQSQNPFSRKVIRFVGWLCVAFGSIPVLLVALAIAAGVL